MQLLSLCQCVLCEQYPHGWVLAASLYLPSQNRDTRPPTGSCSFRDEHWLPFQLAFCLEARWKCISRDLWSKQKKQPESRNPLQASSPLEGEKPVWRARAGAQEGVEVKRGWGLVGCRLSQTEQQVLHSDPMTWMPWRRMSKGNFPSWPFSKLLSQTGHTYIGEQHLWNSLRFQRAWEGWNCSVWHPQPVWQCGHLVSCAHGGLSCGHAWPLWISVPRATCP